ncbi:unnamed protein product [Moneuplotes crassus]|uniref:Uncharacterized protein n=1 Tax=Euplotes crassus TaxID=5936 RepID=A0AAD1Y495_EUPCR|nr:unnamed protein product [Moneuplotes crassus]
MSYQPSMQSRSQNRGFMVEKQHSFGHQNNFERELNNGLAFVNNILKENTSCGNYATQNISNRSHSQRDQHEDKENVNNFNSNHDGIDKENCMKANIAVENRLSLINEVYKQRKQERAINNEAQNVKSVKAPKINQNSKRMLQEKYGSFPKKRVDQRLYEDHKKRKIAQDMREKLNVLHNQDLAHPNTHKNSISSYHSIQTLSSNDGKEIVNRLMDYKFRYNEHEKNLKRKYDDQECTFKPKINAKSTQYASQMTFGMPLEFRNTIDVKKYNNRSKKVKNDKNCTFKPQVCEKSKMIAENKQYYDNQPSNVFARLGNLSKNSDKQHSENSSCGYPNEHDFRPAINPISAEIDININQDDKPRWERLYQLNNERDYILEQKKKKREFEKLQEESQFSFKPEILPKSVERRSNSSVGTDYFKNINFSPNLNTMNEVTNRNFNLRSPVQFNYSEEQRFDELPIQSMNVHERAKVWNQARENKLEKIRNKSKGIGMEECTFRPNLKKVRSRSNLKTSRSMKRFQTANSIQKYVNRVSGVREVRDSKEIQEGKKVGSGNNWTHRATVPKEPTLSYRMARNKSKRSNGSVERNISKELLARNVSVKSIDTKDYVNGEELACSLHNHYLQEDESDTMLQESINLESLQRSKEIAAEKLRSSNEGRLSYVSLPKSEEQSIFNQNPFSKSHSRVELLKQKVISQISPCERDARQKDTPETVPRTTKPPLAPTGCIVSNRPRASLQDAMRISEQEIIEDDLENLEEEPQSNSDLSEDAHSSQDIGEEVFDDLKGVFHSAIQSI